MTEIFSELAVLGDPMENEDQVVQLLASLPDSYGMLVMALETSAEVPEMEAVVERLLHEERSWRRRLMEVLRRHWLLDRGRGPDAFVSSDTSGRNALGQAGNLKGIPV